MRAYPLARAHSPHLELREWLAYARSFSRKNPIKSGLIGLMDARSYIHGLFAYSTEYLLTQKKTLRINDLIMCHLPGSELSEAFLTSIVQLAERYDVASIVVTAGPHPLPFVRMTLTQNGFSAAHEHSFVRSQAACPHRLGQLIHLKAQA
jgi:hypothetical protein